MFGGSTAYADQVLALAQPATTSILPLVLPIPAPGWVQRIPTPVWPADLAAHMSPSAVTNLDDEHLREQLAILDAAWGDEEAQITPVDETRGMRVSFVGVKVGGRAIRDPSAEFKSTRLFKSRARSARSRRCAGSGPAARRPRS